MTNVLSNSKTARFVVLIALLSALPACSRGPSVKADQFDFETIKKREEAERRDIRSKAKRTIQFHSFTLDPDKTIQGTKLNEELVYHEWYIVDLELGVGKQKPPELLSVTFERQMPNGLHIVGIGNLRLVKKQQGSCRLSGTIRPQGVGDATMKIKDLRVPGGRVIYSCPVTFSAAPPEKKEE
ncbi:MAG: hypothetical protein ACR2FY_22270 [Pirellulaceae bacterium]